MRARYHCRKEYTMCRGLVVSGVQIIREGGCPVKEFRLQGGRRGRNQRVMLA